MSKRARTECFVCCNSVPAGRDATCPQCGFEVCRECARKYVNESDDDAHCMSCKVRYTQGTLTELLGKTYVAKEFREQRGRVLFEREVVARAPYSEADVCRVVHMEELNVVLSDLQNERDRLRGLLAEVTRQEADVASTLVRVRRGQVDVDGAPAASFTQKCVRVGCGGFLSTAWKCHACSRLTCRQCLEPKDDDHECDPDALVTVEALRADSRQCPGCSTFIKKTEGCDQMWCVLCRTPFSYRTGRVVNSTIHNPHYYEFMNQNAHRPIGRDPNDIPCGGVPTLWELRDAMARQSGSRQGNDEWRIVCSWHRIMVHLERETIPQYRVPAEDDEVRDLRVAFLRGKLSREHCEKKLRDREQRNLRKVDICDVLEMLHATTGDMLRSLVLREIGVTEARGQIMAVVSYANSALHQVSMTYRCITPRVQLVGDKQFTINRTRGDCPVRLDAIDA